MQGNNHLSSYAAAVPGLGFGSNWLYYMADIVIDSGDVMNVQANIVAIDGLRLPVDQTYIVSLGKTATVWGDGATLMPSLLNDWQSELYQASMAATPEQGVASIGDLSLDVDQGIFATGLSGIITLTEQTTYTDHVRFVGGVEQLVQAQVTPN